MAYHFNKHPDELERFFEQPGCLQAFSRMFANCGTMSPKGP
jgi:hypothetical protein